MKLHHLRDVVAIAERGSLRAASRHLAIAQPALTRSLGELERELGAPLFERHARGMALTGTGQAFVQRATAILHEVRRAREEVAHLQGGTGGRVTVALSIAAHIALLPAALKTFRARYPDVHLRIIEGIYPTLESALRDGSVDFYIGPEPGRPASADLQLELLFENERIVIGRRNHPLGNARSLAELADAEWATTSVTVQAEEEMGALFRSMGLGRPRLVLQSQSALTLLVTLAATDLLTMVPVQWTAFPPMTELLQPIRIRETLPAPAIVLIHRAGLPLTPAATTLLDALRRAIGPKPSAGSPNKLTRPAGRPISPP